MKSRDPIYRCTNCDNCQQVKTDCIWVKVPSRDNDDWCLCGDCRRNCHAKGVELVNADVDFGWVAA